jgi:hypothetical protein
MARLLGAGCGLSADRVGPRSMVEVHNRRTPLHVLGPDDVDAIAALCRRGLSDPPSVEELRGALFHSEQAATVRGDPSVGVVASGAFNCSTHHRAGGQCRVDHVEGEGCVGERLMGG